MLSLAEQTTIASHVAKLETLAGELAEARSHSAELEHSILTNGAVEDFTVHQKELIKHSDDMKDAMAKLTSVTEHKDEILIKLGQLEAENKELGQAVVDADAEKARIRLTLTERTTDEKTVQAE